MQSEIRKILPAVKLTNEYEEFIGFCAMPRVLREIKTQREFAKKFGVSEDTLTDWKKTPGFSEAVRNGILAREQDGLSDVIAALRAKAKEGSPGAARLWLQYVGELQPKNRKN